MCSSVFRLDQTCHISHDFPNRPLQSSGLQNLKSSIIKLADTSHMYLFERPRPLLQQVGGRPHAKPDDTESYTTQDADRLPASSKGNKRVDSEKISGMKSKQSQNKRKRASEIGSTTPLPDAVTPSSLGGSDPDPDWIFLPKISTKAMRSQATYGRKGEKKPTITRKGALADLDSKRKRPNFAVPTPPSSSLERIGAAPVFRTPGKTTSENSSQPDQISQEGNIHTRPSSNSVRIGIKLNSSRPGSPHFTRSVEAQDVSGSHKSAPPTFRVPDINPESSSRRSSPTLSFDSSIAELLDTKECPTHRACPMCGDSVPADELELFESSRPVMTMRDQQKFCHQHKKAEAEAEWTKRGYPKVDWESLDVRMRNLEGDIVWLLERPQKSWFRGQLERRVETGKGRNLVAHLNSTGLRDISVGYYGTRGLRAISEFITRSCSDTIRQYAGSDKLIAARDVSGYVQMVLAPELAMRLVMEDLNVDAERAREIMGESVQLGDLLNGGADLDNALNAREREGLIMNLID